MARIILALCLLISSVVSAQPGYTTVNSRYKWIAGGFDSSLILPRYNGVPSGLRSAWNTDGQLAVDTANNRLYVYSGGAWVRVANYSDVGSTYTFPYSVVAPGNVIQLENDTTANPANYFYGRNSAGRRGWYPQSGIVGVTPTLQQVLTAGSTLTGSNTINGGGADFTFSDFSNLNFSGISSLNIDALPSGTSTDSVLVWTASNGQVKMRNAADFGGTNIYNSNGTLTGNRTVDGGGNDFTFDDIGNLTIIKSEDPSLKLKSSGDFTGTILMYATNGVDTAMVIRSNNASENEISTNNSVDFEIGTNDNTSVALKTNRIPRLSIDGSGNLNIGTLNYTTDTTGKSLVIRRKSDGLLYDIDPALIGGGGSSLTFTSPLNESGGVVNLGGLSGYGTSGQILSSTGTGLQYINQSSITGVNIYNSNGQATANRVFIGNGKTLNFNNFVGVTFDTSKVTIRTSTGFDAVGDSLFNVFNGGIHTSRGVRHDNLPYTLNITGKKISVIDTANGGTMYTIDPALIGGGYDTCTIATFSAGAGFAIDTTAFTDSTIYGSFYNAGNDTLIITSIIGVVKNTGKTIGVQAYYNSSFNTGGNAIATSTLTVTSNTTGNSTSTFTNQKIPPGNWVWMKSPTVTAGQKPTYLSVSLIGYKKRI